MLPLGNSELNYTTRVWIWHENWISKILSANGWDSSEGMFESRRRFKCRKPKCGLPVVSVLRMLRQEELKLKGQLGTCKWVPDQPGLYYLGERGGGAGGRGERWFSGWEHFLHILRPTCPCNKSGVSASIISTALRRIEPGVSLGFAGIHLSWDVSAKKKEKFCLRGMGRDGEKRLLEAIF